MWRKRWQAVILVFFLFLGKKRNEMCEMKGWEKDGDEEEGEEEKGRKEEFRGEKRD